MMEVVGMVDTDVTCAVAEEPGLEEAVEWSYSPVPYLKVRIGSNCCTEFRWGNLMIGIVGRVGTSWDLRVEEAAGWKADSSDSEPALNLDAVRVDYIIQPLEEQGGIRLGRASYCENRGMVGNAGIRRMCCRLN